MMKKTLFIIGIIFLVLTVIAFLATITFYIDTTRIGENASFMLLIIPVFFLISYAFLIVSGIITEILLWINVFAKNGVYKLLSAIFAGICLGLMSSGIAFRIMAFN